MAKAAPKRKPLEYRATHPAAMLPPDLASDRLRLLRPLITARVMELAGMRLCGFELINGKTLTVPDDPWVVKLALLMVLEMNPHERFKNEEEGLMRGMDADNINPYKKAGLIRSF